MALVKDGRGVPAADRGRMGVRGPRGHGHAVPYGSDHLHRSGQLRRPERSLRLRRPDNTAAADRGRIAFAQCLRAVRRARQRGRAGSGLLRRPDSADCTRRVVRGGSWGSEPPAVRSAYRSWCAPTLRNLHNGFRVARTLTRQERPERFQGGGNCFRRRGIGVTRSRGEAGLRTRRSARSTGAEIHGEPIRLGLAIGVEFGVRRAGRR